MKLISWPQNPLFNITTVSFLTQNLNPSRFSSLFLSMDALTSPDKKKASKKTKSKKNPVKVVYISNPMKVKTSASKFRALVQQLTGQDAGLVDPSKTIKDTNDASGNPTALDAAKIAGDSRAKIIEASNEQPETFDFSFEDAFMPEMLGNFPELLASG